MSEFGHQNENFTPKLKRSWAARAEYAARGRHGLPEVRRSENISETGVVRIGDSEDVRGVEEIEHLDHRLKAKAFAELECLCKTKIERAERSR